MRAPFLRRNRPAAADAPAPKEDGGSLLRFLIMLVVLAWAIRSLVVAPFSIPSGSMLPRLYIGDYLLVAKWPYGYSRYSFPLAIPPIDGRMFGHVPRRGDIAVFRHPSGDYDLIKRVIALPGDTVAVADGQLILNGSPVPRRRIAPVAVPISPNTPCKTVPPALPDIRRSGDGAQCLYPAWREALPGGPSYVVIDQIAGGPADDFAPIRVPAGHVFMMGDNRDDSLDSRFDGNVGGIGMVPVERLIGRALVTFWSTDGGASYINPVSWFGALRPERIGQLYERGAQ